MSIIINSPQNTQIKAARRLSQRRYRHEEGRLLIEGVRLVGDAWRSHVHPLQLFYNAELRPQSAELDSLLCEMEAQAVPALACSEAVFAHLTETVTPQGIAAVVALPQLPLPPKVTLVLILDEVRDPGNAGTLLRSAEAAGADFVIFGPGSVDAFNDKVLRAGMGVHFRLPIRVCSSWAETKGLIPDDLPLYLAEAASPIDYDRVDWRKAAGLVVGGEANGARAEMRQLAQAIAIPMQGNPESLNAAMAGTIILFEAARQRRQQ